MTKPFVFRLTVCALMLSSILFLPSCDPVPEKFSSHEVSVPKQKTIQEAYIELTPSPKLTSEPINWEKYTSKTEEPSHKDHVEIKLNHVTIGSQTNYQLGDTYYLINSPETEKDYTMKAYQNRAAQLLKLRQDHPELKLYIYFVNRAVNCDWYGEYNDIHVFDYASYFEQLITKDSQIRFGQFHIADLQDYMNTGYKTDFHVNNRGSYRIYQDIYAMMAQDISLSPQLIPLSENDYDNLQFFGAIIQRENRPYVTLSTEYLDVFRTYKFNYGPFTSYLEDKKMVLGLEDEYEMGQIDRDIFFDHQFSYYGGQAGLVRFEFNQPTKPNLLIMSDSQGRPSRKLIAQHFNTTIFLDDVETRTKDLDEIIRKYHITVALFMGQTGMFELYDE